MKKTITFAILLLFCIHTHAQKFQAEIFAGTFWDKGYDNFMYQRSTYAYTRTYNQATFGILASANIFRNTRLLSGYNFSRRYLEVNLFSNNPVNSFSGTRIYTNSIPLLLEYRFEPKKLPGKFLFFRAGGGVDFNIFEYQTFGMYNQETVMTVTFKYGLFYTIYPPKNPAPFLQGYIGFGDQLGKNSNISLGIGYKYMLTNYTAEMYYYFDNTADVNPELEETFVMEKKLTEISLYLAYSFGIKSGKKNDSKEK